MAELLFRLRNVPESEAVAVRQMLDEHHVDYYETDAGNWGISMPAIWINDSSRLAEYKALINDWQQSYAATARSEYLQRKADGLESSLFERIKSRPVPSLLAIGFSIFIVYVMLGPMWQLFRP
ncbi:MAG: DUF6164 family protein [Granulosicoccaceae bacterium]